MTIRKVLLAAAAAALTTTPAWALPGRAPSNDGTAHAPVNGPHPNGGRAHRCLAHGVAYVAAGTIVSQALVLDAAPTVSASAARATHPRPTYSGDVTIAVTRTNRHARADKGTTKTYTLDHARVLLPLADQNGDGHVDLADVVPGSRAKVIGKATVLRRRCDQTGFTPQLKIRKLIVHAPRPPRS